MLKYQIETVIGPLTLVEEGGALTHITPGSVADWPDYPTPLLFEAANQLREYLAGQRREFDLPLEPCGTPFQLAVWEALRAIPYGEVRSYGEIAAVVGKPLAARAVGGACHQNQLLIVTPCHRVVTSDRRLGGFGAGLEMKKFLLSLEKVSAISE